MILSSPIFSFPTQIPLQILNPNIALAFQIHKTQTETLRLDSKFFLSRSLLLFTLPVLLLSLITLVLGNIISMGSLVHAAISTVSVVVYFCCFVMGFGPIPNILCAEIFPTRVRGVCIAICALTFWIGDIIVTYSLPVMLTSIGLRGVFGIYAIVCTIAWFFVYLKVPETKGMPLEVITQFFAVGAKQGADVAND